MLLLSDPFQRAEPMRISNFAYLLNGLCFAVPMGTLGWTGWSGSSNPYHLCIPIAVMLGTFLTAAVIWPLLVKAPEDTQRSLLAGGLIGFAIHPLAAILTAVFTVGFYLQDVIPHRPYGEQAELSAIHLFQLAIFIIVWWCIIAWVGVGWFTGFFLTFGECQIFLADSMAGRRDVSTKAPSSVDLAGRQPTQRQVLR